ncbi:MAG: carbohydrate ABC transporter permease [Clostridiaceae bacterium]|nr:carbohydrate ABC transporter permease [Clostridiaceae bacterium]
MNRSHRIKKISAFEVINYTFFTLVCIAMLFPLWNVILISFTDYRDYVLNPLMIFPGKITLEAYKYIFATDELLQSLFVTIKITLGGTAISMFISVPGAYTLSKKSLPGRSILNTMVIFTLFFNGGIIPNFLLIRKLNLYNTLWALIIPMSINTWYLLIMRSYFSQLPSSLEESARIDGANDFTILYRIIVPISKPIIATFILFYGVERWNEWWHAMMYINDTKKYPLQLLLRNMIVQNYASAQMASQYRSSASFVSKENIKMATAVVATVPIVIVYPFLQKHFAKGILVGSIKG